MRTGTMPRWLVVIGYARGLVLLFSVAFFKAVLLLFPAWVAVVSIVILASHRRPAAVS